MTLLGETRHPTRSLKLKSDRYEIAALVGIPAASLLYAPIVTAPGSGPYCRPVTAAGT